MNIGGTVTPDIELIFSDGSSAVLIDAAPLLRAAAVQDLFG